jgi:hypothetical protein
MAKWDEIAAILALSVVVFNILPSLPFLMELAVSLLRHWNTPGSRCTELLWKDVPDGVLHECPAPTPWLVCKHKIVHEHGPKCWEQLFSVVFSRAWTNKDRQKRRITKPNALPLGEDFIHIDFIILMAFIISTIGCNESLGSLTLGFSTYTVYTEKYEFIFDAGGVERVEIKLHEQNLIGHLFAERCRPWTPSGEKDIKPWTKVEIENLLNGYPPFYSTMITLQNGKTVPFPIHSMEDVQKGGWVLAVKLGRVDTALPLYFESQPPMSDPSRKPTFQRATEWVREIVMEPFTKAFPGDTNVRAASNALISLCNGQEYVDCKLEGSDLNEGAAHTLDAGDAVKAMDIFNRPTRMDTSQRADLKADAETILVPLLSAAVFGTRDVLRFERKCVDFKAKLPPTLRPSSKIFIRDCAKTGFDTSRRYPTVDSGSANLQSQRGLVIDESRRYPRVGVRQELSSGSV